METNTDPRGSNVSLPAARETWQLLERFNKAALARRFPGWEALRTQ